MRSVHIAAVYSTGGFWATLAGVVLAVVSLLFFFRSATILRVVVLSSQRFAPSKLRLPQQLEVMFDGQSVRNVQLLAVILLNTGRSDITATEFLGGRPVRIVLNRSTVVERPASPDAESPPVAARIIGAEPAHERERWDSAVGIDDGAVLIRPCRITRLGFATLAVQIVVADYHGESLLIGGPNTSRGKRSREILENGYVSFSDMDRHDRRGRRLTFLAIVAVLVLLVLIVVAPTTKVPHHNVVQIRGPLHTILIVYSLVFLILWSLVGGYYGFVAFVYKRKAKLFE